jgi:uncharacterized protein
MRRICALVVVLSLPCACRRRPKPAAEPPVAPFPAAVQPARVPAVPEQKMSILPAAKLILPDRAVIFADVADTPENREIGLMFRRELPKDYGMLFVFPVEQALQFWMKNTLVDLDMVWISADKKITGIHRDVPKSRADTPDEAVARRTGAGKYVLELPAGAALRHKLQVGDRLQFEWKDPPR